MSAEAISERAREQSRVQNSRRRRTHVHTICGRATASLSDSLTHARECCKRPAQLAAIRRLAFRTISARISNSRASAHPFVVTRASRCTSAPSNLSINRAADENSIISSGPRGAINRTAGTKEDTRMHNSSAVFCIAKDAARKESAARIDGRCRATAALVSVWVICAGLSNSHSSH